MAVVKNAFIVQNECKQRERLAWKLVGHSLFCCLSDIPLSVKYAKPEMVEAARENSYLSHTHLTSHAPSNPIFMFWRGGQNATHTHTFLPTCKEESTSGGKVLYSNIFFVTKSQFYI